MLSKRGSKKNKSPTEIYKIKYKIWSGNRGMVINAAVHNSTENKYFLMCLRKTD